MARRIRDAEFDSSGIRYDHRQLARFWWVDDPTGMQGVWSRQQAYRYLATGTGTAYVRVGHTTAAVEPCRGEDTEWIQTDPDGILADNLLTLAQRHALGLPNR
jgi:hypothetical protein